MGKAKPYGKPVQHIAAKTVHASKLVSLGDSQHSDYRICQRLVCGIRASLIHHVYSYIDVSWVTGLFPSFSCNQHRGWFIETVRLRFLKQLQRYAFLSGQWPYILAFVLSCLLREMPSAGDRSLFFSYVIAISALSG